MLCSYFRRDHHTSVGIGVDAGRVATVHRAPPSLCRRAAPGGGQARQLRAENLPSGDVDEDVAGVVRHADLLHDGTYCPVGQVVVPRGVGRDVGRRVALREAVVDGVDDGDGQGHGDEVE